MTKNAAKENAARAYQPWDFITGSVPRGEGPGMRQSVA